MTGERIQFADFTCGWRVLSDLQRPRAHTLRASSFCVEYWYARPLQFILNLVRCDGAPLSCWNRFLGKTDSIYLFPPPRSVLSVFSIFSAVSFHLHSSDLRGLKGDSVFQYQSVFTVRHITHSSPLSNLYF